MVDMAEGQDKDKSSLIDFEVTEYQFPSFRKEILEFDKY
jgi:hypothetical protein